MNTCYKCRQPAHRTCQKCGRTGCHEHVLKWKKKGRAICQVCGAARYSLRGAVAILVVVSALLVIAMALRN